MRFKLKLADQVLRVRYLKYIPPSKAQGRVGEIYREADREFGFAADPLVLHSVILELFESF